MSFWLMNCLKLFFEHKPLPSSNLFVTKLRNVRDMVKKHFVLLPRSDLDVQQTHLCSLSVNQIFRLMLSSHFRCDQVHRNHLMNMAPMLPKSDFNVKLTLASCQSSVGERFLWHPKVGHRALPLAREQKTLVH